MPKVFAKIGRSEDNLAVDRFLLSLARKGRIPYSEIFAFAHEHFPRSQDMDAVIGGALRAGLLKTSIEGTTTYLEVVTK